MAVITIAALPAVGTTLKHVLYLYVAGSLRMRPRACWLAASGRAARREIMHIRISACMH